MQKKHGVPQVKAEPLTDEEIPGLLADLSLECSANSRPVPKIDPSSPIYAIIADELARLKPKRKRRAPQENTPVARAAIASKVVDDKWADLEAICRPSGEFNIVRVGERMTESSAARRTREEACHELDRETIDRCQLVAEREREMHAAFVERATPVRCTKANEMPATVAQSIWVRRADAQNEALELRTCTAPTTDGEFDDPLIRVLDEPETCARGKSGNRASEGTPEGIGEGTSVIGKKQTHSLGTNQAHQTRTDQTQIHNLGSERSAGKGPQASTEASEAPPGREAAQCAPATNPSSYERKARKRKELADVELPARRVRRPRKAMAPYKDLREDAAMFIAHDELIRRGPVLHFTLNVHPDWKAKAIASGSPANLISKRIRGELRRVGLQWQGWFTIEIRRGLFHLHGACLSTPEQAKTIRRALCRAAGKWKIARQRQCKTGVDPDIGWATYAMKDLGRAIATKMYGPGPGIGSYPFKEKSYAISREIMSAAKTRYNEERAASMRNGCSQPAPIEAPANDEV